jgi:hypothetical protein
MLVDVASAAVSRPRRSKLTVSERSFKAELVRQSLEPRYRPLPWPAGSMRTCCSSGAGITCVPAWRAARRHRRPCCCRCMWPRVAMTGTRRGGCRHQHQPGQQCLPTVPGAVVSLNSTSRARSCAYAARSTRPACAASCARCARAHDRPACGHPGVAGRRCHGHALRHRQLGIQGAGHAGSGSIRRPCVSSICSIRARQRGSPRLRMSD